jgi:hypothetical protein
MTRDARYSFFEVTKDHITIIDIGHNTGCLTITNDAENVVKKLVCGGIIRPGMRLFYYDSTWAIDEIIIENGHFAGFKPGGPNGKR